METDDQQARLQNSEPHLDRRATVKATLRRSNVP
jgi:hypothetical protein